MAEHDIIHNMIFRPGQSQGERMPVELGIHHVDVDERTGADLLRFIRNLAARTHYFAGDTETPDGNWSAFFPADENAVNTLLENTSGEVTPHLALFVAFLELYKIPQELINRITGRHLDFYYREVLRFARKAFVPDRAHLLLELKKNAAPVMLGPEHRFSAGKDAMGTERIYVPNVPALINAARVIELRSFFVDGSGHGRVLAAPIANSADGLGQELNPQEAGWHGFGHRGLPAATIGFALAAPVLRMREGTRSVTVTLGLGPIRKSLGEAALKDAFEIFLSGEQGWLGPYHPDILVLTRGPADGCQLRFSLTLGEEDKAVIDYDPLLHGGAYCAAAPVLQVLLREQSRSIGYNELRQLTVRTAALSVQVAGLRPLNVENDNGTLNAKKPFLPFGPKPVRGSRFVVECPEALSKKLSELTLTIQWQDAPARFSTRYQGYGDDRIDNSFFTAAVSFRDGDAWHVASTGEPLFTTANGAAQRVFTFQSASVPTAAARPAATHRLRVLERIGSRWARQVVRAAQLRKPLLATVQKISPESRQGAITFALERGFLHDQYRTKYVEQVVSFSKSGEGTLALLTEPYTPTVEKLFLGYKADSGMVRIGPVGETSLTMDDCTGTALEFFHTTPFGQMREHGFQREQFGFLADKRVHLLPRFDHEGELLIGLEHLHGGDSVNVLLQVAAGSADPDLPARPIFWFVLCDNYWRPLSEEGVVRDTTNHLLTSGILSFVLPREATTEQTILPGGCIWLKAAVDRDGVAVSRLIQVAANALEVRFVDQGNDPAQQGTTLAAGSIGTLINRPPQIKSICQPYASFGGCRTEPDAGFHVRVAERLRHKNRCITPWDYERIILDAFPAVHRVKCIPHATGDCWLAPGNVLIVVVPDLHNRNMASLLQPKVDADTLRRIADYLAARIGGQVKVRVCHPRYQQVLLDFKVRFCSGSAVNFASEKLNRALVRFLSPWAHDGEDGDIGFGGTMYKSVLLDFVEKQESVDYVEEFRMFSYSGTAVNTLDLNEVQPQTPDAMLVSAERHRIDVV